MVDDRIDKQRRRLLDEIESEVRATEGYTGRNKLSDQVMAAMAKVPRHRFVPPDVAYAAYANRPQPIGFGQTISQPYMVAIMTDLLDLGPNSRVLEIGCGCGFQAAVLAEVAGAVYSVEKIDGLAKSARKRLTELGYQTVHIKNGDGYKGWSEEAPFDAVIVTAAAACVPPALVKQLKPGGRMVIPIGMPAAPQVLKVGEKNMDGKISFASTLHVAFVPLVKN